MHVKLTILGDGNAPYRQTDQSYKPGHIEVVALDIWFLAATLHMSDIISALNMLLFPEFVQPTK